MGCYSHQLIRKKDVTPIIVSQIMNENKTEHYCDNTEAWAAKSLTARNDLAHF